MAEFAVDVFGMVEGDPTGLHRTGSKGDPWLRTPDLRQRFTKPIADLAFGKAGLVEYADGVTSESQLGHETGFDGCRREVAGADDR